MGTRIIPVHNITEGKIKPCRDEVSNKRMYNIFKDIKENKIFLELFNSIITKSKLIQVYLKS